MTPAQIIALVRDALIVAGVAWLIFHIYREGEDRVRRQDLEAVQKQLTENNRLQSTWEQRAKDADTQNRTDLQNVAAAIAADHRPVIVRIPASGGGVPQAPAAPARGAGGGDPSTGGGDGAAERDIRPELNDFALWLETKFGYCRKVRLSWPDEVTP